MRQVNPPGFLWSWSTEANVTFSSGKMGSYNEHTCLVSSNMNAAPTKHSTSYMYHLTCNTHAFIKHPLD